MKSYKPHQVDYQQTVRLAYKIYRRLVIEFNVCSLSPHPLHLERAILEDLLGSRIGHKRLARLVKLEALD
jgi:hypothetical protein